MIIIGFFTGLSSNVHIITVYEPTQSNFTNLYAKNLQSFKCPCRQTAIAYGSFIEVWPLFHPVCSSWFVSDEWRRALLLAGQYNPFLSSTDFIVNGYIYFNALNTLCTLANVTISNELFIFTQTSFINDRALSSEELLARTQQILTQFESTTVAEFKRNLAIIRSLTTTTYTAGYGDVYWYSIPSVYDIGDSYFVPTPAIIENCSCALSDECKNTISLYNYTIDLSVPPRGVLFNIPHMYKSCFNMQSLLLSSLECFFEQTCFDPIQEIINVIANFYFIINGSVLLTNSTRFPPKTTVGEIINELMIERWYENVRYVEYYQQCAPEQCSYLLTFRNNALYIVTTIIGLFGGLSVALKIIVPIIVRCIRNRMRSQATPANVTGWL
ncbi:unnamed protein product [Rotaria sp. Silwood2]|nr:unnamed protein product [Rotaria sp. Silwood2]CAF3077805.1 unnamed protein product [Rotaria sp. Silwood2]CAF3323497.1 unnamed protein product [Rotaria sp. Silwood2]CAF3416307.1 unnamed protein product [Rotaria sp. Silwood2]CAF4334976.1 unnamed protein product [Rotaria sp. Silwood2]